MKMWIARDEDGTLFIHANKPQLSKEYGFWDSDYWFVPDEDHPEVTFENSPMEVEIKLIEK